MADYYGTTLCRHAFAVNDPDKFEKLLRRYHLTKEKEGNSNCLWYDRDKENKFEIYGYAPLEFYDSNADYVELANVIQPYLLSGETAVFIEVGTTKCRYHESGGYAVIITPKETKWMVLHNWVEDNVKKMRNKENHITLPR